MQDFVAAEVNRDVADAAAARRSKEQQIAALPIAARHVAARFRLLRRRARQVNAVMAEDVLRKGRAVKISRLPGLRAESIRGSFIAVAKCSFSFQPRRSPLRSAEG